MSEDLFAKLRDAVVNCDEKAVSDLAQEVVNKGLDPLEAIEKGLSEGAKIVGDKFDKMEIFLTELMMAGEVLKLGLKILLPQIQKERISRKGTVVIGTVKGDIHEIGKNIVAALLQANGFEVHDLGIDVDIAKFIEKAEESKADIIALSALMSSTIGGQKDVIDYLKATGKREKFIVMVGGGPTTEDWAEEIGADGYAETASEGVNVALKLIQKRGKA
jgi:corrinoid protein of di/trimethylamine methyltransferase